MLWISKGFCLSQASRAPVPQFHFPFPRASLRNLRSHFSGPNRNGQTDHVSPRELADEEGESLPGLCWKWPNTGKHCLLMRICGEDSRLASPHDKAWKTGGKMQLIQRTLQALPGPSKALITYYPKEQGFSLLLKDSGIYRPIFWPLFSVAGYTSSDKGHWLPCSASSSSEEAIVFTAFWSHRVRRSDPTQCLACNKHSIINFYCCLL